MPACLPVRQKKIEGQAHKIEVTEENDRSDKDGCPTVFVTYMRPYCVSLPGTEEFKTLQCFSCIAAEKQIETDTPKKYRSK